MFASGSAKLFWLFGCQLRSALGLQLFSHRPQLRHPLLAILQLRRQSPAAVVVAVLLVLGVVALVHLRQDLRDLVLELLFRLLHPRVTHRLVARCVRPDLAPVDRHAAQLPQARGPRRPHRLAKHLREVLAMENAEAIDRAKVRSEAAGEVPETKIPAHALRDLPAAVHPRDRPEHPKLQQHPRWIGVLTHRRIAALEDLEIETLDQVADEKHRVAWIERLAQMRWKQLPLVLLVILELDLTPHDRHLYQMTSLGSGS